MQKDTLKAPIKIESYLLGPISNNIQEGFASTKPSIFLTAPNGINNKGKGVWWEEIELWVKGKGGKMPPWISPLSLIVYSYLASISLSKTKV